MKHERNANNIIYDQLGKLNVYEYSALYEC